MKNINFATKVRAKETPKVSTENNSYAQKRREIMEEINHPVTKVNLDKSVYKKTEIEKAQLKEAKQLNKTLTSL